MEEKKKKKKKLFLGMFAVSGDLTDASKKEEEKIEDSEEKET